MPAFDLRYIQAAKYINNNGTISHTGKIKVGDAMTVNLSLRFAEGRNYAEGSLAEYMRKATGGSISIAVKYLSLAVQKFLYGAQADVVNVGGSSATKNVDGIVYTGMDVTPYVAVSCYAPTLIDSVEKYTCVLIHRTLFGPPDMNFQTASDNINFSTPTTSGEFLPDNSDDRKLLSVAICDTYEEAIAWCDAVLAT